jgi:hypothetical protein
MNHPRPGPRPVPVARSHAEIRAAAQESIEAAVVVIKCEHQVGDASAYAILVQASIDGHTNVRDAAVGILAKAG